MTFLVVRGMSRWGIVWGIYQGEVCPSFLGIWVLTFSWEFVVGKTKVPGSCWPLSFKHSIRIIVIRVFSTLLILLF